MPINIPVLSPETVGLLLNSYCMGARSNWAVLKASGSSIRDYLQGQITQDIRKLTPSQGIHSSVLTPQGKAVGELYILEGHDGELVMLSPAESAEAIVARLRQFAIGHQVRIGVVDTLAVCSLQGANASEGLKLFDLAEPGDAWLATGRHETADTFALTSPADPRGFWIVAAQSVVESVLNTSDRVVPEEQVEAMRIIRGLIRFGSEWDATTQPMNANMVEFGAVSFDKGCYVGQEVTSRMHWRSGVKKKLYRIETDKTPDTLPAPTKSQSNITIGEIRSAAIDHNGQCFGIAWLPIETVEAGQSLQQQDGTAVTVLEACHA